MKHETIFSPCRQYRYTLWRELQQDFFPLRPGQRDKFVQFIGVNPSKADERINDNTITRLIDYASRWGFASMCMTNLFAFRSTDPEVMKAHPFPVHPEGSIYNDGWLKAVADEASLIVCCWGKNGLHKGRAQEVEGFLRARGRKLHCFRLLADGTPEHPLYLPKKLEPQEWI